jgi:hypothetical protein
MFKFDFVDLTAATPKEESSLSKDEIIRRNADAFRQALAAFRAKNPDVVLEGFNGFGGTLESTSSPFPFKEPVESTLAERTGRAVLGRSAARRRAGDELLARDGHLQRPPCTAV